MSKRKRFMAIILILPMTILSFSIASGASGIKVSAEQKLMEVAGEASRQMGEYAQLQGSIEYLACTEGGKTYESMLVLHCKPTQLYEALLEIGLKPGAPAYDDESGKHILPRGDEARLFVEWEDANGKIMRFRAEDLITNRKTQKTMEHVGWVFVGSQFMEDPATEEQVLQAELTGSLISTHHGDQTVILQNPLLEALDESIYSVNGKLAPKSGTKVKLIVDASPLVQIYVLISGQVQGVEFRDFIRRTANQMKVYGYVKNLPDGKVAAVLAGPEADVNKVLEKLRVGPASAEVTDVKIEKREFSGEYRDFQIRR